MNILYLHKPAFTRHLPYHWGYKDQQLLKSSHIYVIFSECLMYCYLFLHLLLLVVVLVSRLFYFWGGVDMMIFTNMKLSIIPIRNFLSPSCQLIKYCLSAHLFLRKNYFLHKIKILIFSKLGISLLPCLSRYQFTWDAHRN